MAAGHAEFGNPGQKEGLEIWRIEKMVPRPVDKGTFGEFYTGDSYLILNTKKNNSALDYDLHFWLGAETSQDEAGACAYKTVELDDFLGGRPIQYREVQGHESAQFLSLFGGSIIYLSGGVESGFNKVDPNAYVAKFLHCKGRRKVRVSQCEKSYRSMNQGDVFILDAGLRIWQWNGRGASRMEKSKALEMVTRIRDNERGGKSTVYVINDGADDNNPEVEAAFWEELGGKGTIKTAEEGGGDDAHEEASHAETVLYECSDASGSLNVREVGRMPLSRDQLNTNEAFILDCGSEIFVWVGKGATQAERSKAMEHGKQFITEHGRPDWTPVTRLPEGGETPLFKEKFADWHAKEKAAASSGGFADAKKIAKPQQKAIDIKGLHTKKEAEAEPTIDNGTGTLEVYRIENFQRVKLNPELNGQFYMGDSYLIQYTYNDKQGKEQYIIYFWLGDASSQDEIGAAALMAKEMDDALGGAATQIRVKQGKEPNHFLSLFKGRMIVHQGGCASGFTNANDVDSYDTDGISLFHVRGTTAYNTRATQVAEVAASLNTNDVFVLETPEVQYVWNGAGASEDEKKYGHVIAKLLQKRRRLVDVTEGQEPDEFWAALGGKGEYANFPHLKDVPSEPRLFQGSNATGVFAIEEIPNFGQSDLDNDDVMILDTYMEVYVWVGADANVAEKKAAMETALEYVKHATDGRDPDTPVILVHSGAEPSLFTCHFHGWNPALTAGDEAYQARLAELKTKSGGNVKDVLAAYNRNYTYAELQVRPAPEGVDPSRLETYLTDAEFSTVMGMSKADYEKMPVWKKTNLKKKVNLF